MRKTESNKIITPDDDWNNSARYININNTTSVEDFFLYNRGNCDLLLKKSALLLNKYASEKLHKVEIKVETTLLCLDKKEKVFIKGWGLPPKIGSSMIILNNGTLIDFQTINLNSEYFWNAKKIPESWIDTALTKTGTWCERYGPEALESVFLERIIRFYCPIPKLLS